MMVTVAVVALLLDGQRVWHHRLVIAMLCEVVDRGARHIGTTHRLEHDDETLRVVTAEVPDRTPSEFEGARRQRRAGVKSRAVRYPWLTVEPDPPSPG